MILTFDLDSWLEEAKDRGFTVENGLVVVTEDEYICYGSIFGILGRFFIHENYGSFY